MEPFVKFGKIFDTVYDGFDKSKQATNYHFTQCPVAAEYETITDEKGFRVSKKS